MTTALRLGYEFKRRLHHRNTQYSKAMLAEDVASYLTEGLMILFENEAKYVETTAMITEDLKPYVVPDVELKITDRKKNYIIAELKDDHYKLLNQKVCASKEGCKPDEINVRKSQSDDKNTSLSNTMIKPSFEWRETIGNIGEKGFYVWDNCEFMIDKVIVDYLRKPDDIHIPSLKAEGEDYVDWDGKVRTEDVGLEMTTYAFRAVVDLAVASALRDIGDLKDFQTQINKILNLYKIYR